METKQNLRGGVNALAAEQVVLIPTDFMPQQGPANVHKLSLLNDFKYQNEISQADLDAIMNFASGQLYTIEHDGVTWPATVCKVRRWNNSSDMYQIAFNKYVNTLALDGKILSSSWRQINNDYVQYPLQYSSVDIGTMNTGILPYFDNILPQLLDPYYYCQFLINGEGNNLSNSTRGMTISYEVNSSGVMTYDIEIQGQRHIFVAYNPNNNIYVLTKKTGF